MAKSIFASRMFWLNALTFLAAVIDQVMGTGLVPAEALAVLGALNIGLRAITTQPVRILP